MIAAIPVKLSERLPYKHLLPIGEKTIIETVYEKVSQVFEAIVYSKIEVPVPYVQDASENIMELVYNLKRTHGTFALIGGDMPFFTLADLEILRDSFDGGPVSPSYKDGNLEPMFSIYSGNPAMTRNLRDALYGRNLKRVEAERFSDMAFFNINTENDYHVALEILKKEKKE